MTKPGEWLLSKEPVEINVGRRTCKLTVRNTGDRAIQIGSHFHFFEVNRALDFDREKALGMHLSIPGGMGVRFEPGQSKEVELAEYGGTRQIAGFNDLVDGGLDSQTTVERALRRAREQGFIRSDAAGARKKGGERKSAAGSTRKEISKKETKS